MSTKLNCIIYIVPYGFYFECNNLLVSAYLVCFKSCNVSILNPTSRHISHERKRKKPPIHRWRLTMLAREIRRQAINLEAIQPSDIHPTVQVTNLSNIFHLESYRPFILSYLHLFSIHLTIITNSPSASFDWWTLYKRETKTSKACSLERYTDWLEFISCFYRECTGGKLWWSTFAVLMIATVSVRFYKIHYPDQVW